MRIWYLNLQLPNDTLRTRFALALALAGPTVAILRFGEVIARKSLDADPLMVTLITMVMPISNFFAIWTGRMLEGRDQRKYILVAGLIGSGALLSGVFLTGITHLILIFIVFFLCFTVQLTGQNRILQQHVDKTRHGNVFGVSNGIREAMAALMSLGAGVYMDQVLGGYRQVYFAAGIFSLLSTLIFATMPTRAETEPRLKRPLLQHFLSPLREVVTLLKRRPDFLRFELGFMVYGIAFMSTLPVVPIFLVDELSMDYTQIGFARGTMFQLTIIPAIAIAGRMFDKMGPHKLASRVFTMLALFPVLLILAKVVYPARMLFATGAFIGFGAAMGGVALLWNISSVRFAGDEDAGVYQSVHLAATGVRGMFAPLLAYAVMQVFGTIPALVMAAVLWIMAGQVMNWLEKKDGHLVTN